MIKNVISSGVIREELIDYELNSSELDLVCLELTPRDIEIDIYHSIFDEANNNKKLPSQGTVNK